MPIGFNEKDYDTPLSFQDEIKFQQWRQTLPKELQNTYDYDLRGYWLSGMMGNPETKLYGFKDGVHLTDTFKKPNHMTFSSMSKYNGIDAQGRQTNFFGGKWSQDKQGSWNFNSSSTNEQFYDPIQRQLYFNQYEKGNTLNNNKMYLDQRIIENNPYLQILDY